MKEDEYLLSFYDLHALGKTNSSLNGLSRGEKETSERRSGESHRETLPGRLHLKSKSLQHCNQGLSLAFTPGTLTKDALLIHSHRKQQGLAMRVTNQAPWRKTTQ